MKYLTVIYKCKDQAAFSRAFDSLMIAGLGKVEVCEGVTPVASAVYDVMEYCHDLEVLCEDNEIDTDEVFTKHFNANQELFQPEKSDFQTQPSAPPTSPNKERGEK